MKKEKLPEARVKGAEIAEILAYLKSKGLSYEGQDKGYLKCKHQTTRIPQPKPTNKGRKKSTR